MLFVLICTEGDVSEPVYVEALVVSLRAQQPQGGGTFVEVIPIPLGGNQGHVKIIEKAEARIREEQVNPDSLLSCAEADDQQDKWLICDYDKMDESGMEVQDFRRLVETAGYRLILNKPNFEFFILALLLGPEEAQKIRAKDYTKVINREIQALNERNKSEKGFPDIMKLPTYSKKLYASNDLFGRLLQYNPELVKKLCESPVDHNANFTEMPDLIRALEAIFGDGS